MGSLILSECEKNGHVNAILDYTNTDPKSTNIPKWDISCPNGVWENPFSSTTSNHNCKNWYAFNNSKGSCSLKTKVIGRGRGKLDFGNCYKANKGVVKVSLDGNVIDSAQNGTEKVIEFDFSDGNELKLSEENYGIIMFNSFEVLNYKGKI